MMPRRRASRAKMPMAMSTPSATNTECVSTARSNPSRSPNVGNTDAPSGRRPASHERQARAAYLARPRGPTGRGRRLKIATGTGSIPVGGTSGVERPQRAMSAQIAAWSEAASCSRVSVGYISQRLRCGPDALAEDARGGDRGEDCRGAQQVVDLVGRPAGRVGPGPPAVVERRVRRDVAQVGGCAGRTYEQGSQRGGVRGVVEVAEDDDVLDALGSAGPVDLGHPLCLALASSVRVARRAVALGLEVVDQDQQ